jgi:hypothetical protein
LNKYTQYNQYLKAKPGTYKLDPKLTQWTQAGALAELHSSAGELPQKVKPEQTLEEKLVYLIEADPTQAAKWTQYLNELQIIKLYAQKYPIDELMKSTLVKIQNAVLQRFDEAQDPEYLLRPFGPVGVPKAMPTAQSITDPITSALMLLNDPSASDIATAVRGAIGNNPTAEAISAPIIDAIQDLGRNPTADEIAEAVTMVLPTSSSRSVASTMLAPTVVMGVSEEKKEDVRIASITAADIASIRAINSGRTLNTQNIPANIWRYVATRAGISSTIKGKDQVLDAVLRRPNEPSVNLLLNLIKSGYITRNSTANDYQDILEDMSLEQSAVS